jgi:dipeptidyl aminopeptidase/acylaminoacyl peptidase
MPAAIVLATAIPVLADAQAPSIAQFIRMKAPVSGSLAPDGTLYYVHNPDGLFQLYAEHPGAGPVKLTDHADGIGGYTLSPDGKWIVVSAAIGGSEQNDLYLLETATGRIEPLFVDPQTVFGAVVWRRDSGAFAYRANLESKRDFHVYVYDLGKRETKRVFAAEGDYAPADFTSSGDKLMLVKVNAAAHQQLFELDLAAGEAREVTPKDEKWIFEPVGYEAGDKSFLTVSDYQDDFATVRRIDLASGAITVLASEYAGRECDGAVLSEDRSVLAVLLNEDGYSTLHLRRLPENVEIPAPAMEQGIVSGVDFCGRTLLFNLSNAKALGVIYRWDVGASPDSAVAVTSVDNQGIDTSSFRLPELIRYKSFDNLEIPAFLYLPSTYQRGTRIPFIVTYHGGPESQYRPGFSRDVQYFLTRGFGVLAPNVRGSSGYGRKYLEMDNYKQRMDSVMDGVWAARWLVENNYTSPGRIGAYGGSYGGFMVVACVAHSPRLYGAACNVVGIVNFRTFLERTKDYRRALREAEYGPLSDPEFLESISPIRLIERITTPMLIAHGRNDPRVPLHEAEQLYAALKERGRPVELLVFDDEGHGFRKEPNRIKFYEKLAAFFERHLAGER